MTHALSIAVAALLALGDPNGTLPGTNLPPLSPDVTALSRRALNTPAADLNIGDRAPNFSYQSADGAWRRLDAILAQGSVLLTLGADAAALRLIEEDRRRLMDLGVIPVAVIEQKSRAARALVQRLELKYMVLADAKGIIASQFNAVDSMSGRQIPTWFVIDRMGLVRGIGRHGLPTRDYASLAANALGIPLGATVPTGH